MHGLMRFLKTVSLHLLKGKILPIALNVWRVARAEE
jgi:hypothetical protein